MNSNSLTNSMKDLIENLTLTNPDDCSDEFQLTLNKLIEKAHEMSSSITLRRVKENEKRRLSTTSSADVLCITTEIPCVNLDSDSDEEIVQLDDDNTSSSNDRLAAVTKKHNNNWFDLKPCVVKLRRMDAMAGSLSQIQGSKDKPVIREKEAVKSGYQVSSNENKNISNSTLTPRQYKICICVTEMSVVPNKSSVNDNHTSVKLENVEHQCEKTLELFTNIVFRLGIHVAHYCRF